MLIGVFLSLYIMFNLCNCVFGLIILNDSCYKIVPIGPKHTEQSRNGSKSIQLLPDPPRPCPSTLCMSAACLSRVHVLEAHKGGLRPRGKRVLCVYLFARPSRGSVLTTVKSGVRRGRPVA